MNTGTAPSTTLILSQYLQRELRALARELTAYPDDQSVWVVPPGIRNSAGTLALHLCGNLRHFVGAQLGGTGYERHRDAEFAARSLSRAQLAAEVDVAITEVSKTLSALNSEALEAPYPVPFHGRTVSTRAFLLHLLAHTGYHLGQIDYHRRLTTGNDAAIEAVSIAELP